MPRDAAKRIVMAAWLLHGDYMGLVLGRMPERKTLCFSGKVAAAGDELVLAAWEDTLADPNWTLSPLFSPPPIPSSRFFGLNPSLHTFQHTSLYI